MSNFRQIPSVEKLLQLQEMKALVRHYSRPLALDILRSTLGGIRKDCKDKQIPSEKEIVKRVGEVLDFYTQPKLVDVINATGVILHTNLGRAPLSKSAIAAVQRIAGSYNTLEFDLEAGERASRNGQFAWLLSMVTGSESALVVNNNAAAVLLVLTALTKKRKVIISRSQVVEIGGGFRINEVMAQSGAKLVEVGTTNRVEIDDFRNAIDDQTAAILRVHHSNYKIIGFTSEPTIDKLANLAHERGILLIDDLGSGTLLDTTRFGLAHEPMIQESVKAGVDLICFSGDKLFGGPQAGIIIGRRDLVIKMERHPLMRALRPDKTTLAALEATLQLYFQNKAVEEIPVWQMIARKPVSLKRRAVSWVKTLGEGKVVSGFSTVGGGSLPEETLPTFLLSLDISRPDTFVGMLMQQVPPIIARMEKEQVVFDPRTILLNQDNVLLAGIKKALEEIKSSEPQLKQLDTQLETMKSQRKY